MGWFDTLRNLLPGRGAVEVRPGLPIRTTDATFAPASPIGTTAAPKRRAAESESAILDKHFFRLGDYVGPHSCSPNGRWVLFWSDSVPSMGIGGHRESGNGS